MNTLSSFGVRTCILVIAALLPSLTFTSCSLFRRGDAEGEGDRIHGAAKSLGDYRLKTGSVMHLEMFEGGRTTMASAVEVMESGDVLVPKVGEVSVTGQTPVAAAKKIEFLARKTGQSHLSGPRVHVKALDRRAVVHVVGNVNQVGPVTFFKGLTVEEAIEAAGGATARANTGSIGLTSGGRKMIVTSPQTRELKEGDVINVPRQL